jgi:glycosyltransferase involved in cell wall biosynthesis
MNGLKTRVFADCAIEPDARQVIASSRIDLFSVFPSTLIARIKVRALIWPLMAFIYAWMLVRYTRNITDNHIICTVSGTLEYLSGISLAILLGLFRSKIIVQMYFWETREHNSSTPSLIRLYRHITEWLVRKAIDKGYLLLTGQGREVATHISKRLTRSVQPLPIAIDWSDYNDNKLTNSALQVGFLGVMRAEKGFRQFVKAVENFSADIAIIVQMQLPRARGEPNAYELIERLKRNHPCQIFEGELSIREYRRILANIDIAILPYRPDDFSKRTSNLFSESVGLGKLIVAPKATLMGKMLEFMNIGIAYSPYTSKALCNAIRVAVSNFDELSKHAKKKADYWRKENSADSFLKNILQFANSSVIN